MSHANSDASNCDLANRDPALSALACVDLPPLAARALLVRAQRQLQVTSQQRWARRSEMVFLLALGTAHCCWALLQVLA